MKATIYYTSDGEICREVECDKIEPYGSNCDLVHLVGAGIYTNQPIVVTSSRDESWNNLSLGSEIFDLTLTIGHIVKKWEGARCLILEKGIVSFWHEGAWYNVVGDTLIENMRDGGPVELDL